MPKRIDRRGKKSRLELYLWVLVISIGVVYIHLFYLSSNEVSESSVPTGIDARSKSSAGILGSKSLEIDGRNYLVNVDSAKQFPSKRNKTVGLLPELNVATSTSDSEHSNHSVENWGPLLQNLRDADVNDAAIFAVQLPAWKQVVDRFGDRPRLFGLENCEAYRNKVAPKDRLVGVAGAFNSGTNLMANLMMENCRLPGRKNGTLGKASGLLWQVNWGKHQPPRYRLQHKVKEIIDNENILPVVMIRDPFTWLQSMCKRRYSAHWFHVVPKPGSATVLPSSYHCPNFIPSHIEKDWYNKSKRFVRQYYGNDPWMVDNVLDKANFTLESTVIPVRVRYKVTNEFHDSLVHMWLDWYTEYFDATFPRLILRLEDLVFFPRLVLQQICECVGGDLAEKFRLLVNSAKQGSDNVHGTNKTGLLEAMYSHVYVNRTMGMTIEDVIYANAVLQDSVLLETFNYRLPAQ